MTRFSAILGFVRSFFFFVKFFVEFLFDTRERFCGQVRPTGRGKKVTIKGRAKRSRKGCGGEGHGENLRSEGAGVGKVSVKIYGRKRGGGEKGHGENLRSEGGRGLGNRSAPRKSN